MLNLQLGLIGMCSVKAWLLHVDGMHVWQRGTNKDNHSTLTRYTMTTRSTGRISSVLA